MREAPLVLVTGAGGRIGRALVDDLGDRYRWRLLDRVPVAAWPELVVGDVTDASALDRAMAGVDVVVHLAGQASASASLDDVWEPNLVGTRRVYEAAARHGVGKVVLASSNRVVERLSPLHGAPHPDVATAPVVLGTDVPHRPDGPYGVSKAFGETLAGHYADAHGVASVCLRLGSVDVGAGPAVEDKPRAWGLWLSRRDLVGIVAAAIDADVTGCAVVYACSANTRRWWDLEPTGRLLGYRPVDDSESLLHAGHRATVPPAPTFRLPWGERLAGLTPVAGRAYLVHLGQSGFYLATPGRRIAVDPFLTATHDRLQAPMLAPDALVVDDVLVTHTHRDHLDGPALEALAAARPATRFVGPPTVAARLGELGVAPVRITVVEPGRRLMIGDVEVTAIDARHRPTTPDALGYVLRAAAGAIYHTGDTELDDCLLAVRGERPDVLLVPVNGRKGNMTAEQAAALTGQLGAPVVVPMHYGCLQPEDDLVERFLAELARLAPSATPALMTPGAIAHLPLVAR